MGYYIDDKGKRVEIEDNTSLYLDDKNIVELDLSNNINLNTLYCQYNQLTKLNVTKNINLNYLSCDTKTNLIGINHFLNNKNISINQI